MILLKIESTIQKTKLLSFHKYAEGGNTDLKTEHMSICGRQAKETDSVYIRKREWFLRISRDSQNQEKAEKTGLEIERNQWNSIG